MPPRASRSVLLALAGIATAGGSIAQDSTTRLVPAGDAVAIEWTRPRWPEPAAEGTARGLRAFLAVPGMSGSWLAVMRASLRMERELEQALRPRSPLVPLLDAIAWSEVLGATAVVRPTGPRPDTAFVLECAGGEATPAEVAATLYRTVVDGLRGRGIELREVSPWPDTRGIEVPGSDRRTLLLHRGSQVVLATGTPPLEPGATEPLAGLRASFDLDLASLRPSHRILQGILDTFGLPDPETVRLRQRVTPEGYRMELTLTHGPAPAEPEPRSLGEAPRIPLLEGMLVVARTDVAAESLRSAWSALAPRPGVGADAALLAACTGGWRGPIAVGIAAPARGGLYPRVVLAASLMVGEDPLPAIGRAAEAAGLGIARRTVEGVEILTCKPPGLPAALWPSAAVTRDVLWISESTATLRSVLAARDSGATGAGAFADETATPCPPPADKVALAEFWFDAGATWLSAAEIWAGPMIQAALPGPRSAAGAPPLVEPADLPDPGEVAATLGRGRAVLYAGREELTMSVRAPVLGPVAAAIVGWVTETLPGAFRFGIERHRRDSAVMGTQARAERIGDALRRWRRRHDDRLPDELSDLAPLLDPADPHPFFAPHGPWSENPRPSFHLAPAGMTAAPDLPTIPGRRPPAGREFEPGPPRPVFAFCGHGYRDHHLLILADGEVVWVRSERVLEAVLGGR